MKSLAQQTLNREEKEAIGLLSMGTFLEYFDLMLYVHMAVFLNERFFPKSDPHTAFLLSAFAFCSMYLLRPFGAILFGYLGDKIGRKTVVTITTFIMACSCCTIAILPTYDSIGISASVIITICRMLQGLSSMGEVVASEIYLTEFINKPFRYPAVALLTISCIFGGIIALIVSFVAIKTDYLWRGAFILGAIVAVVGFRSRVALKETAVFSDARRRIKEQLIEQGQSNIYFLRTNLKTMLSFFFMQCTWSMCFYFAFVYCNEILKTQFGYSLQNVITHNLIVTVLQLISYSIFCVLSYKIPPLKILQFRLYGFCMLIMVCPFLLDIATTPLEILLIQAGMLILSATDIPAAPIIYSHFPILQRFRCTVFIYALSRLIMYTVGSFGVVYLVSKLGNWGIFVIMGPLSLGVMFALFHFKRVEEGEYSAPLSQKACKAALQN